MGDKSLCTTYLLWLFLGWFGVHHFYLKRDKQAFLWWSTLGGCFFFGWIRDIWRIPDYVQDANESPEYLELLTARMKTRACPIFSTTRFTAQMLVGYLYGLLVRLALPEETPNYLIVPMVCLGVSVGVWLVGNIGREQGRIFKPFMATIATYGALTYLTGEEASYMYCSLAAALVFNQYREHRRVPKQKSLCKRLFYLGLGVMVIASLWSGFLYFNATITTEDGEKIKIRDSVNHFFKSPAWLDFKNAAWEIYEEGQRHGWKNIWDEIIKAFDPTGEANAFKVLNLDANATQSEIRRTYKKLAVEWHPDRYKGDDPKGAQDKFIEIQQAYEVLTTKKKSSRSETSAEDESS